MIQAPWGREFVTALLTSKSPNPSECECTSRKTVHRTLECASEEWVVIGKRWALQLWRVSKSVRGEKESTVWVLTKHLLVDPLKEEMQLLQRKTLWAWRSCCWIFRDTETWALWPLMGLAEKWQTHQVNLHFTKRKERKVVRVNRDFLMGITHCGRLVFSHRSVFN